jgi:hypothetical protein
MSKVLSTRLDDEAIEQLESATKRLGITKKRFLEEAIKMRADLDRQEAFLRTLDHTFGAWVRPDQTPEETVREFREASRRDDLDRRAYLDGIRSWTPES